jgi:hypothetical protein
MPPGEIKVDDAKVSPPKRAEMKVGIREREGRGVGILERNQWPGRSVLGLNPTFQFSFFKEFTV